MKKLKQVFTDFLGLVYPTLCVACKKRNPATEHVICVFCIADLTATEGHLKQENLFTQRFWGRIDLQTGAAMFDFVKGGRIQKMIHALKYENRPEVGQRLGEWYGGILSQSPFYQQVDIIVPVPLHARKQHERGYNQSAAFAQGLASSMHLPWIANGLKRKTYGTSQTNKSREDRLANVLEAFEVDAGRKIEGKHILLVDDVLTTGATLEACALKILELPDTKISIVTIALARR